VSGADLKKRVEAIMSNRPATKLNSARKFLLAASAAIAVASPVLAGLMGSHHAVAQTQNGSAPPLSDEIAQRLAEQRRPRTVVPLDPKAFDQYVGYYLMESGLAFTITRDGDHFLFRLSGQQSVEIYPESSSKFFAKVVTAQLSFATDTQGRVTELVLHQGGFERHARRIDEADAKNLEAAREARIANKAPSPGTEESLRRFIDSMQRGQPNYDEMTPTLAAANRSHISWSGPLMKSLGALKSITFRTVNAQGFDVYDATFEKGRVEFSIAPLTSDGKVAARAWHISSPSQTEQQMKVGAEPTPEPAVTAILAAFDKYEVVGIPEAHGMKDVDDFILSLIQNPAFSEKVNDIAVECGNSLYQPVLDRYISGEDVPFTEVRKVWRNTTQPMCGLSGFFEQFFPLVRALNQKLPPEERIRVLAGDPPIDWEQVKTVQELDKSMMNREASITSVMEKEVLSKHRKALMLFGTMHLMHAMSAVSTYEKNYPNVTFVISELAAFDTDLPRLSDSPFASWPVPSLARAKGTWLGALDLTHFIPPPFLIDKECNVHNEFPGEQQPMENLVDAFLYLGPQDLRLREQIPADIALDEDYERELQRRMVLQGFPGAGTGSAEFHRQIVASAEDPLFRMPKQPPAAHLDLLVKNCLERKSSNEPPR
jgi:Domain of unknown function (DUF3471)